MVKEETTDPQERTVKILEEMLRWIKITSLPQVKQILLELLPNNEKKIAYHYSDGRGSEEVAKIAGVGASTVPKWWKSWIKAGAAEPISVQGGERANRVFSLEDFGIEIPALKNTKTDKTEVEPPTSIEKSAEEKKNE